MAGAGNEYETDWAYWLRAFILHLPVPLSNVLHGVVAWQVDRYTLNMMPAAGLGTVHANNIGT